MPPTELILLGCAGGLLPDVVNLTKYRTSEALPTYLKSAAFYVGLVAMVILGGFAVYLLEATDPKQALLYGYSGPKIVSSLGAKVSERNLQRVADEGGFALKIRRWWGIRS